MVIKLFIVDLFKSCAGGHFVVVPHLECTSGFLMGWCIVYPQILATCLKKQNWGLIGFMGWGRGGCSLQ